MPDKLFISYRSERLPECLYITVSWEELPQTGQNIWWTSGAQHLDILPASKQNCQKLFHFQFKHIVIIISQTETADELHWRIFNNFIPSQKNSQSSLITSRLKVKAKNRAVQTPQSDVAEGSGDTCTFVIDQLHCWIRCSVCHSQERRGRNPPDNTHTEQTRQITQTTCFKMFIDQVKPGGAFRSVCHLLWFLLHAAAGNEIPDLTWTNLHTIKVQYKIQSKQLQSHSVSAQLHRQLHLHRSVTTPPTHHCTPLKHHQYINLYTALCVCVCVCVCVCWSTCGITIKNKVKAAERWQLYSLTQDGK